MNNYTVINDNWIELTEGPYSGIVYKYGRVQLIEEDDQLRIKFEYQLAGQPTHKVDHEFIQHIGPILTELIDAGLITNGIVYTGGTDAD